MLGTALKLKKRKKNLSSLVHAPKNVKLGIFTSQSCRDGKEMYKKVCVYMQHSRCHRRGHCSISLINHCFKKLCFMLKSAFLEFFSKVGLYLPFICLACIFQWQWGEWKNILITGSCATSDGTSWRRSGV